MNMLVNMLVLPRGKALSKKFYNFLIIKATSQKAHPRRKKTYLKERQ